MMPFRYKEVVECAVVERSARNEHQITASKAVKLEENAQVLSMEVCKYRIKSGSMARKIRELDEK